MIAGISSSSGKTTITLGLLRVLKNKGFSVQPYKCGPDYIDPEFHTEAANQKSRNLDSWIMGEDAIKESFAKSADAEFAVIEGVMGLFDGASSTSIEGSSAHIAKLTSTPIILTLNARGIARTVAPIVRGFIGFEKDVNIIGIIANNVGSAKHADILREALEAANLPPLLGCLPRDENFKLPERHLGLVPEFENRKNDKWYDFLAENIEKYFDIDLILKTVQEQKNISKPTIIKKISKRKIGIALDDAFHFYYEDNLDILKENGFEIINFSPLNDEKLPNVDCLYIGGGYPEMFAEKLSNNKSMLNSIAEFANENKPIYAECGGLIYLSQSIKDLKDNEYKMCGFLPFKTKMENRLHRLGYVETKLSNDCFFGKKGTIYRGHEFHWSSIVENNISYNPACEGRRLRGNKDWQSMGIQVNNVYATYIHAHFASNKQMINSLRSKV